MIPGKIVRFLEQHANMGFAGTRDRDLVPFGCRVSAWRVHPDGHTMTLFIPEPLVDRVIASLEENGQLAVTVQEHPTHETYQLKGKYVSHRGVEADDVSLVARFRERLVRSIRSEIPPGVPEARVAFATGLLGNRGPRSLRSRARSERGWVRRTRPGGCRRRGYSRGLPANAWARRGRASLSSARAR